MFRLFDFVRFVFVPAVRSRQRNIDRYAGEEETLRAALEANPNDAVAHNNLGYLMETVYKVGPPEYRTDGKFVTFRLGLALCCACAQSPSFT